MEPKQVEELIKAMEQASEGNWMPLALVCGLFGALTALVIYIYHTKQKTQDAIIKDLAESEIKITNVLVELKTIVKYNSEEIKELRRKTDEA